MMPIATALLGLALITLAISDVKAFRLPNTRALGTESYTMDGAGNRTWRFLAASSTTQDQLFYGINNNRLASIQRNGAAYRSFTSDAAGNILTDTTGSATTTYGYNNANRLRTVTKAGLQVGEYTYNAFGQLILRNVTNTVSAGVSAYFYNESGQILSEHDGVSGLVKREYIWLADRPIAIVDTNTVTGVTSVFYIHADHLNRPISLTDSSKAVVGYYNWMPFGGLFNYSGTKGIDLRFPGQMFQAESGLHYNWNRHYDPSTGRYTQPDPLGLVDAPSRFAYVGGDPLQKVDPEGLQQTAPPPPKIPGGPWQWSPDPSNSRGGRFVDPNGGNASWDPDGHWDCWGTNGERQRYDTRGNPITSQQAHNPPWFVPRVPPWSSQSPILIPDSVICATLGTCLEPGKT